jgi:hypothetical protein
MPVVWESDAMAVASEEGSTDPIFIIGTERSGSNLLRLILNAHSAIAAPHPPHIMQLLAPCEQGYGDLAEDGPLRRLAGDVLRLVRLHIYPWEVLPSVDDVLRRAPSRDLFGVFAGLYDAYRAQTGKRRWACKSTFMIHFTGPILACFPAARLIWLVRDPRDVASSSRRSVFSPYHPYDTAELWRRQQRRGVALAETLAPETLYRLRYEELVGAPERVVRDLCGFLDEPFEGRMLRFFETPEAVKSGRLSESWRNTAGPIRRTPLGRYRADLTPAELRWVESRAGRLMRQLGYAPDTDAVEGAVPSAGRRLGFRLLGLFWRLRTEARSLVRDRNHFRRWARDLYVTYLRWVRGGARRPGR